MRGHDEEGFNVMLFKETVSLMPISCFNFIISIQAFQGGLCYMNLSITKVKILNKNNTAVNYSIDYEYRKL